jgi:hypothetical protein
LVLIFATASSQEHIVATAPVINSVGSLDATRVIPLRLEALDMSATFFAELCSSNKTEFSRLMNGTKPLSGTQTIKFFKMLDALDAMVSQFSPMPIAWRDPEQTRLLLEGCDLLPDEAKENIRAGLEKFRGGLAALAGKF